MCNLSDYNMVYSNVANKEYNRLSENFSSVDTSELTNILISGMKYVINESTIVSKCRKPYYHNLQKFILLKEKMLKKKMKKI